MTRLLETTCLRRYGAPLVHGGFWRRWREGVRKIWQRPDWESFAGPDWPETILNVELTDDFHVKQGRSTGRWILHRGENKLSVYLKRHYRLGWWKALFAAAFPGRDWSPAFFEMRQLRWAAESGFPAPKVVAAGEFIGPRGRLQSVLAIEELDGMLPLHKAIPLAARQLAPSAFRRWKSGLIEELARLARFLHDRRRFHKDLYLCHFFISREDIDSDPRPNSLQGRGDKRSWRGRIHLIDFHRFAEHRWTWPVWRVKDLGQLLYASFLEGVDDRDRLRFWRHYLGRGGRWSGKRRPRFLTWCVRFKGRRYLKHNAKLAMRTK